MAIGYLQSPWGWLKIEVSSIGLRRVEFVDHPDKNTESTPLLVKVTTQLAQYIEGKRKSFDINFDFDGGSDFQHQVWQALTEIPYGKTISYRQLAESVGRPKAFRAVGSANGKNPIPIIIPCHRVIASDGSLGGYSAGLERKKKLLQLENIRLNML